MPLIEFLANLAIITLSVLSVTALLLALIAAAEILDPIIRNPWTCADCKARYATEAEVIEHERLHLTRRAAA